MRCFVAVVCAICFAPSTSEAATDSFAISTLKRGQQIEVQTDKRYFRFRVVDPTTGQMIGSMSEDGQEFGEAATVYLLGATRGRQQGDGGITLMRMHELKVGMSMELGVFDLKQKNRWITAPVRRFAVLPYADRLSIRIANE